jgi:hypothetical protein
MHPLTTTFPTMTAENLAGLLDPAAESDLDAFVAACRDDPLPTPSRRDLLVDLIDRGWGEAKRRAFRLADRADRDPPEPITPAFAVQFVAEPPEPMSAHCDEADWKLLNALPDAAGPRLEALYAYRYEGAASMRSPTELLSLLCEHYLREIEVGRQQRRSRHAVQTCPAGEAVLSCLGIEDDTELLDEVIDQHTRSSDAAGDTSSESTWFVEAGDLDATRQRYRERVRYNAAAFQVYAEMTTVLPSRPIPDVAHVAFSAPDRPDGYLLPFYVPQREGIQWFNGYDLSLQFVTSYAEALLPEQYAAASEAYDDVADGRAELILVADTERLTVRPDAAGAPAERRPPWLLNALERVQDHPFDDGHGGRDGPFEQGRLWNPFVGPR